MKGILQRIFPVFDLEAKLNPVYVFQIPFAHNIYKDMADAGVVARYRGGELHCKDCIRLTIGRPHENEKFLELLKKTAEKYLAKIT